MVKCLNREVFGQQGPFSLKSSDGLFLGDLHLTSFKEVCVCMNTRFLCSFYHFLAIRY